jgi:hypothetical protein
MAETNSIVLCPVRTPEGRYILDLEGWQIEVIRQAVKRLNKQNETSRNYAAKKKHGNDEQIKTKSLKPIFEIGY